MPGILGQEVWTGVGMVVVRRIEAWGSHVDGVGVVENGFVENAVALFVDGTQGRRGQGF